MAIIYLVTNRTNDKKYIGQTVQTLKSRRSAHECYARNPDSVNHSLLQRAIAKYGEGNFTWEVIFESDDMDLINHKEMFYILLYDTHGNNGYNATLGGGGNWKGGPVKVNCNICQAEFKVNRRKYNRYMKMNFVFICSEDCLSKQKSRRQLGTNNSNYRTGNRMGKSKCV